MSDEILVTSFTNPDIDGLACMIAYSELLKDQQTPAVYKIFGRPHIEAKFVIEFLKLELESTRKTAANFKKIILVDAGLVQGLDRTISHNKVIELIDHRKVNNSEVFINAKIQNELVGSCATLIAEKFRSANIKPSKSSAALLYSAVVSNTLNFKGNVTTDRDKKIAAWLKSITHLPQDFIHQMFGAKSDLAGDKLHHVMTDDYIFSFLGGKGVGIGQIELVGAENLYEERQNDIISDLRILGDQYNADYNFLSMIDLEDGYNLFIALDESTKKLLSKTLKIKFNGNLAKRDGLIMRKETTPLIKEELE